MFDEIKYSDAELVQIAIKDTNAFGLLMERYQIPLFRYIRRISQASNEDVEDLLQEVFIKIYKNLNAYDEMMKFSSWTYRIAHNHVLDYFRKVNARPRENILEDEEWVKIASKSLSLENEFFTKDCISAIRLVINELPFKYREVLLLRFIEEMEYEEIMDILQKPKGTVATLIARGREKLKIELKKRHIDCF